MSPYEPPGYRIISTPAWLSRFTDAAVFICESHTAWFRPYAVEGTVPSPSSALIVTLTTLVDACTAGPVAVSATPARTATMATAQPDLAFTNRRVRPLPG